MNLTLLFAALLQLEGPSGDAAGQYGIRPCYVAEANRILGRDEFRYPADCLDDTRARQMMRIVIRYHATEHWTVRDYLLFHRLGPTGMHAPRPDHLDYAERGENLIMAMEEQE